MRLPLTELGNWRHNLEAKKRYNKREIYKLEGTARNISRTIIHLILIFFWPKRGRLWEQTSH